MMINNMETSTRRMAYAHVLAYVAHSSTTAEVTRWLDREGVWRAFGRLWGGIGRRWGRDGEEIERRSGWSAAGGTRLDCELLPPLGCLLSEHAAAAANGCAHLHEPHDLDSRQLQVILSGEVPPCRGWTLRKRLSADDLVASMRRVAKSSTS